MWLEHRDARSPPLGGGAFRRGGKRVLLRRGGARQRPAALQIVGGRVHPLLRAGGLVGREDLVIRDRPKRPVPRCLMYGKGPRTMMNRRKPRPTTKGRYGQSWGRGELWRFGRSSKSTAVSVARQLCVIPQVVHRPQPDRAEARRRRDALVAEEGSMLDHLPTE